MISSQSGHTSMVLLTLEDLGMQRQFFWILHRLKEDGIFHNLFSHKHSNQYIKQDEEKLGFVELDKNTECL